jgi:Zn-dependent peptidase ImmA (M78 family)/DNA-binding transcriptional regulator YiaG
LTNDCHFIILWGNKHLRILRIIILEKKKTMTEITRVKLNNPAMLAWAREEIGLTTQVVATRFNKSQDVIEAWESGKDAPTFRQLTELANYYKRPVAALFLPSIPPKSPLPHDYRTLSGIVHGKYQKDTLISYREVFNMLMETRQLLTDLKYDIVFSLPKWSIDDDPESKALHLRTLLGIPIEQQIEFNNHQVALDAWRSTLFDNGVIARVCKIPIEDARAFCLFAGNLAGIGLSNEDREHGKIFSLFHEVCHLALRQPGVSGLYSNRKNKNQRIEQYCDRFSASFLLPSSNTDVVKSLELFSGSIDNLELAIFIANKFKVSKYVALRRALDLELISPQIYWDTISAMKISDSEYEQRQKVKRKGGGNYTTNQISYIGRRFLGLVMEALTKNNITPLEAKRMLGIDPSSII